MEMQALLLHPKLPRSCLKDAGVSDAQVRSRHRGRAGYKSEPRTTRNKGEMAELRAEIENAKPEVLEMLTDNVDPKVMAGTLQLANRIGVGSKNAFIVPGSVLHRTEPAFDVDHKTWMMNNNFMVSTAGIEPAT